MAAVLDIFNGQKRAAAVIENLHLQRVRTGPIHVQLRCQDGGCVAHLQSHRGCGIAEKNRDFAVSLGNFQTVRLHFRPHDHDAAVLAAGDESAGHDQAVNKAGTLVAHVHDGDIGESQQSLHVTPRAREKMIGTEGGKNHKVDIREIPLGVLDSASDGLRCHCRGAFTLGREPALANAAALDNPLAGDAQKTAQLLVGYDALRQIGAHARNSTMS